jgi:NAD(P)-dependent dehydrogenase (short-subunit alcohol dehydrogenase family)
VAIVTGATEGIGAAVAKSLVCQGASVVGVARRVEPGRRMVEQLGPKSAVFLPGDVAEPETASRAVAAAADHFGPVDVLINNAAIDLSGPSLIETTAEDARRAIEVNLLGALWMLQATAEAMLGRGGSIVNVASRTGIVGVPTMAVYGATKAALLSLTRTAALELADDGIRVNAVAPGLTETPLVKTWIAGQSDPDSFRRERAETIPLGRFADPSEVSDAILFLASSAASHITGVTLPVDGGYTAA